MPKRDFPPLQQAAPDFHDRPGSCPECEHEAVSGSDVVAVFFRRLFRLRPPAASCPVGEEDYTPWGNIPCGCRDAFHGS